MNDISTGSLEDLLKRTISDVAKQPEFSWDDGVRTYALDSDGTPAARVGAGCCDVGYDLWSGLRNPATIGLYPAGFEEIWDYYANLRKQKTDETGRATIFQVARSFEEAKKRFTRCVIVSAMLPVAPEVFTKYNAVIHGPGQAPWEGYGKVWSEVNRLIDTGITRMAYHLYDDSRAVVVMNSATTDKISRESVPMTRQGASHGVCKGGNYSQKSVAVLTGLAQFGVSRMAFRDEVRDGAARRLLGPLRSLVIFDAADLDESNGMVAITDEWKRDLMELSDFTSISSEINAKRYCTYIAEEGETGCGKCLAYCPSKALANSSPTVEGSYAAGVERQSHRFWEGSLQFDNGSCCDERGQLSSLYDEWMCGRCVSICAGEGRLRVGSG